MYREKRMKNTGADVVVVGGGVMGCSIAFHLAERGVRVTLLERDTICSGNTARSAAFIRMYYVDEPDARMAVASLPYFQRWEERIGGDCGFTVTGFVRLPDEGHDDALRDTVAMLQRVGAQSQLIGPDQLAELQPGCLTEGIEVAAYEPAGGYADPVAATRSLARAAAGAGADLREHTPVTNIVEESGRVVGVSTEQGIVPADAVVVAANSWTPRLLETVEVDIPINSTRAQLAYFERPAELRPRSLCLIDGATWAYARPAGERMVVGMHTLQQPVSNPDSYDSGLDASYRMGAQQAIAHRLPSLGRARPAGGHAALYDMTPDAAPIIGGVPGHDGLFVAAGFSGTGFKIAPAVGDALACMLCGGSPLVDVRPFRYQRFAEGDLVASEFDHGADVR